VPPTTAWRIGEAGFEPAASATRTQRSSGLSYSPLRQRPGKFTSSQPTAKARRVTSSFPGMSFGTPERATGLEPATSTLARLRSTN
jgi:hypothetical protein